MMVREISGDMIQQIESIKNKCVYGSGPFALILEGGINGTLNACLLILVSSLNYNNLEMPCERKLLQEMPEIILESTTPEFIDYDRAGNAFPSFSLNHDLSLIDRNFLENPLNAMKIRLEKLKYLSISDVEEILMDVFDFFVDTEGSIPSKATRAFCFDKSGYESELSYLSAINIRNQILGEDYPP